MDVFLIFFGFIVSSIPVIVLAVFVFEILFGSQINWQDAQGVIEESSLQRDSDREPFPAIRYKFLVDDQPYWGDQRSFIDVGLKEQEVESLVSRHPIGTGVVVYFDPDQPDLCSTLTKPEQYEPGSAPWKHIPGLLLGTVILLALLAIGIVLICIGLNQDLDDIFMIRLFN